MNHRRRDVLSAAGGLCSVALAGCLDEPVGDDDVPDGDLYASFFTLAEFAGAVAGESATVENAVPEGEHGHGWEPPSTLVPEIAETDAFVYLDAEGFQHWVDDAVPELEDESDLALIDALAGIDLLEYDDDHDHGHGEADRVEELAVGELTLLADDETVAYAHGDHWHDDPLSIPLEDVRSVTVVAETDDGDELDVGGAQTLAVRTADGHGDDVLEYEVEDDAIAFEGLEDGFTELVVQVLEDGEVVWEAPPLETEVGEHEHRHGDHEHGDDGHDHGHGHSHGEYDAKFFSDPVLARRGVENVRDGLIAIDSDNEAAYEENAAAYLEELTALHEEYEQRLSDREHDAVVLAGHDSFRYLGERYGFEIHTPVGLSPDAAPSSEEIADTVAFIEEQGIEYVLWDYFDGDRLAETIAAEADTVEDTLMVSPAESTVAEWQEDGYGDYLGQMREINLPAFERALGSK
ncbi:metal ABC transporter solute-binding protein, Zn/Mn family [Natronococcus occultus]|uniref:ABC-type metal ion transport system, periplasmic component/surface adhesin n=1 Tax=Natronococcus occultus SP4 TaxID=694430 RepID=L0JYY9_9EURY|nr:zinc ABC transporter substrate-binding protein [Natronococcus occultus]AGB37294.1 ABC-type metal ion transport system, periplasmic component/surface adhesin [Natronococcus occultus SP4]